MKSSPPSNNCKRTGRFSILSLFIHPSSSESVGRTLLLFLMSILGYVFVYNFATTTSQSKADPTCPSSVIANNSSASLRELNIRVTPPAYTKIQPRNTNNFNLRVPEGFRHSMGLKFRRRRVRSNFIFSGNDSIRLNTDGNNSSTYTASNASSFYNISWSNKDGSKKSSDFYQFDVIKDQPPAINVTNLNQFTEFSLNEKLTVDLLRR